MKKLSFVFVVNDFFFFQSGLATHYYHRPHEILYQFSLLVLLPGNKDKISPVTLWTGLQQVTKVLEIQRANVLFWSFIIN